MPRCSVARVGRAGAPAVALLVALALGPAAAAQAAPDPPTDDVAPVPVQADAVADGPYGLDVGDRNRDGLPDAFVARWNSGDVLIRQGTRTEPGTGRMDDDVVAQVGGHPREVAAVDWDGDGSDDAVTLLEGGGLHVWAGELAAAEIAIPHAFDLDTGDIDGDGDVDAVVARYEDGAVEVVRNDTLASDAPGMTDIAAIAACAAPTDVELADVTGDGTLDLVVACYLAQGVVEVRPGLGDGSFGAAVATPAGATPYRLAAGDVDGDGIADIAVTGNGAVRILRGLGGGSARLGAAATYAVAGVPRRPLLTDLDGDGRPDLAGTTTSPGGVSFRLNRGDGTFGAERRVEWATDAWDLRAADVTGDGRQDLVGIAYIGDAFRVWEGRPAPAPVVELSGLGVGVYEGDAGVALDLAARVLGPAQGSASTLTVKVASGLAAGDVLSAAPAAPIAAAWDATTGTLALTAATPQPVSAWRAALRTVRFAHVGGVDGTPLATAGRRVVRAQLDALPGTSRSIDVWLRPPDAGDVRLSGLPIPGETLSLELGAWGGTPPIALRPTLERCSTDGRCIALATTLPYVIRRADLGTQLRVRVLGSGPDGTTATAFSARTPTIRALAAPGLLGGPNDVTADAAVELAFGGEAGATFACSLDGAAATPCVSPVRYAGLLDGPHTIGVTQALPSGQRSTAAVRAFTVRLPVDPPDPPRTTPVDPPRTTPVDPPRTTPVDPPRPPGEQRRPALVAPRAASAAQLRRGLVVRVRHVAKGAKATATLQSGKRRVVATSSRATRAGTLTLKLRAARGAVARLGRRGTLGLAVTIAPPGARRVSLTTRIAYRR